MSQPAIWNILNRDSFFVKNVVKSSEAKTSDKLDVYDPATRELLLECREPELGVLTKFARFAGGSHDRGTPFDMIAQVPGDGRRVLRASRGSATLTLGGQPIQIFNHDEEHIGRLKKKLLAFGNKFQFSGERGNGNFLLLVKSNFLGSRNELLIDGKTVAWISTQPATAEAAFYKEGRFAYIFSFAPEMPANDFRRQVLLAFAIVRHRVNV